MLRFLLPHADSAIVFEYQRGPDSERDLRCAVLRRQGASDAPEYRILPCGFNAAFFLSESEQGQICNTDEEMVNAMLAAGMRTSPKLAINDYKHVILGTNSVSQQAGKLRLLASEHSLAQRALPHLDRLIASVVKQEVNFNDFVRVAVTIVQDKLGAAGKGQDRARFTLRQSRSQIEQWISNRDACERALALDPEVQRMRQSIATHERLSDQLREDKKAVPPMLALARKQLERDESALAQLQERRNNQLARESARETELENNSKDAKGQAADRLQDVATEEGVRKSLHLDHILDWAADIESLPTLRSSLRETNELIALATSQAKNIAERFDRLLKDLNTEHEQHLRSLGQQETDLQTLFSQETNQIADAASEQREALHPKQEDERKRLAAQREQLSALIATATAQAKNAAASAETQEALEIAIAAVEEHDAHLDVTREASERAKEEAQSAKEAFAKAEHSDQAAKAAREAASLRLQQARDLLAPADGTLLSALRAHPDQDWKTNLARVISPSLLHRTDLQAAAIDQVVQAPSLYGWHLATEAIDAPEWANDDQIRARIDLESRSVDLAREAAKTANTAFGEASQRFTAAKAAANLAHTELKLVEETKRRLKGDLTLVKARQQEEIKAAAKLAATEAGELEEQMRSLDQRSSELSNRHADEFNQIEKQAREQRIQAQARRDKALLRISDQKTTAEKELQARHKQIDEQREQQLSDAGVDTKKLRKLSEDAEAIEKKIRTTEERSTTVSRWRTWIADGGHARLPDLIARQAAADQEAQKAEDDLQAHRKSMDDSASDYKANLGTANDAVSKAQDNVNLLTDLLARLGLMEHSGPALPSSRSPLDLQLQIRRLEGELETVSAEVRTRFIGLRDKLCEEPGPVRDLVDQRLKESSPDNSGKSSVIDQASRLAIVHGELRSRIVPSITNSANTILESVRQFRVQIQSFETEMKRFNGDLQKGLSRVHGFQRLSTVEIHMTTDFSTLGFMKGLDAVDAAAREHIARGSVFSNKTDLPDASVSVALRQLASLLGPDSALDVNLERHTMLRGSAHIDGKTRAFQNQNDLKHISSTGLSAILLISLLSGMLNMVRGDAEVYMPWVTDEVGKFDVKNFAALISMLKENRIDPVTASPHLSPVQYRHFGRTYTFQSNGRIARWASDRHRPATAERKAS
ncbi:MAG: ATP-binding protein [Rhodococcus sp. (in: high G+C Gram-positive bacteria)]|uniref:ATP-binding protein n=1 Tax=Rhodococcus sp. TaxID=1831 RepID=UPI002AD5C6D1|nr:ATP-binding protein [Rhodococcus sp. (in: high G+C Gram-positive bacteria)]